MIKEMAAPALMKLKGTSLVITEPAETPITVTIANASMVPTKTNTGLLVLLVMRIDASCVLSPSSAKKIVTKVLNMIFQSILPISHT